MAAASDARPSALAATLAATLMIAAQVGSKAARDALFLDVFAASELPKAMLVSALLSGLSVIVMSQGLAKLGPRRLVPSLYLFSGIGFVAEWFLVAQSPKAAGAVVYLHVATFGSLMISGFWSVVSERFDPHTAKRAVARITAGATAGGLLGGLIAERVAAWMDARSMLFILAAMNVVCGLVIWQVGRGSVQRAAEPASVFDGLRHFREAPYLKMLGVLVALTALTSGVLDYAFKAEASASFATREELMSFFAIFYTVTGLITVLAQAAFSKKVLEWLGIGGTIALLPASVILGGGVGVAFTRLWTVVMAKGVEYVMSNSLYQSGYQLLFTPLAPEKKRPTKTLIDVGFDRLGTAVGSGIVIGVVAVAAPYATRVALGLAVVGSLSAMWVALRLNRGYVQELASSLKSGRLKLADSDVIDATTRRTLADTTMAIDREQLLAQIEALRKETPDDDTSLNGDEELGTEEHGVPLSTLLDATTRSLVDPIEDLLSGQPRRMRRVLRPPLDVKLMPFVIPLLGSDELGRAARRVLRQAAPRALGQLIDALLDEAQQVAVRRRLPEIIRTVHSQRAAAGLMSALTSNEEEVRERAARALSELVRIAPELAPSRDAVFAAVDRELKSDDVWVPRVFMFLEVTLDPEPLRLALSALRSDDTNLRGTSYEYLENVLPESLRNALWPHLKAYAGSTAERASSRPPRGPEARRSQEQLVGELRKSVDALTLDPSLLAKPSPAVDGAPRAASGSKPEGSDA